MPRYQIVIVDPASARDGEVARGVRQAELRAAGTIHSQADSECPEGRPNCRNCGDPSHIEQCQSKGHCPDCGTKHGIAPDSVIAKHGYALVEVAKD
jgi:hypothetical protein